MISKVTGFDSKKTIPSQLEKVVSANRDGKGYVTGRINSLPKEWVGKTVKVKVVKE